MKKLLLGVLLLSSASVFAADPCQSSANFSINSILTTGTSDEGSFLKGLSVRPDHTGLVYYGVIDNEVAAIALTKRDSETEGECNVVGVNKLDYREALPEQ